MFGFFGVMFLGVVWEGLQFALWAIATLATLTHMAFWAVLCRIDETRHKICAHPWIRKARA
jgi:hypothetical protein